MLAPDTILLEHYRITFVLNDQPGSAVFRAIDVRDGRPVLACLLRLTSAAMREDLPPTARQIAALNVPGVLPLLDHAAYGEDGYLLCCADPGGNHLDHLLRERSGPMAETTVLRLFDTLLTGLEELHKARPPLFLGDLAPTDIWITPEGQLRIAPYTLVRPIGSEPSPYRAPELANTAIEANASSDLYAIGAVLYQLLTGWAPPSIQDRQAGTPLVAPRQLNPNLSALCEQALLRALELKVTNRYQVAREMRVSLDTVLMVGGKNTTLEQGLAPAPAATITPPPLPVTPPTLAGDTTMRAPAGEPPTVTPAQAADQTVTQPVLPPAPQTPPPVAVYQTPLPAPGAAPAPRSQGGMNGCLVAAAILLSLLLLAMCVALIVVGFLLPTSPLRGVFGFGAPLDPLASLPTVTASVASATAPSTVTPELTPEPDQPTAIPTPLPSGVVRLQSAREVTQTHSLDGDLMGMAVFSPDGTQIALVISNQISIYQADELSLLRTLEDHDSTVGSLAFSPDGSLLASGALGDTQVRLWDVAGGDVRGRLDLPAGWVRSLAFSPDGSLLAVGDTEGRISIWDVASQSELRSLTGHTGYLGGLAFAPDGALLLSASRDGTARIWDVASGVEREELRFETEIDPQTDQRFWLTGAAFAPDGRHYAVGGSDQLVHIFDASSGERIHSLEGHENWITLAGLSFGPDSSSLLSASFDGSIRIWDVQSGAELQLLRGNGLRMVSVRSNPDGTQVLGSSDEGGEMLIWDAQSGEKLQSLRIGQGLVTGLTYSPDSTLLASAGINGNLRLYERDTNDSLTLRGASVAAQSVAFTANNRVVMIDDLGRVSVTNLTDGTIAELTGLDGPALAVAASSKGTVAAGSATGRVVVWDSSNNFPLLELPGSQNGVYGLSFSNDGNLLATVGGPLEPVVQIWSIPTQRLLSTLAGHEGLITAVAFRPGSQQLASSGRDGSIRIWDVGSGQELNRLQANSTRELWFTGIGFSPDGELLAAGSIGGNLLLFDAATLERSAELLIEASSPFESTSVLALSFRPDGDELAISVRDGSVRIFGIPGRR